MNVKLVFTQIIILFFTMISLQAQSGTIRGNITDGETGEPLLGATVRLFQIDSPKGGSYTDLEGNFTIKTDPGTYSLIVSFVSYKSDTLTEVIVQEDEVTVAKSLIFSENYMTESVEILAKRNAASSVSLYNKKRNAIQAIDGISFDLVQRTGDNNAAAAMARVTGVTVEGGRYVYVRGLGDRYSKTTLNGAELPGLDPNRNTVQMDMFPSNLIDNIIVYKTFTPNLPGSFSGGLVDVKTKDFPDKLTIKASVSAGYNPQANLIDNFLTYNTGQKDWQGFDDGTRDLPIIISEQPDGTIPVFSSNNEAKVALDRITKSFNKGFDPVRGNSGLNKNYLLSIGNQFLIGSRSLGYIANFSYRDSYSAYERGKEARWNNTSSAKDGNIASSLNTELALNGPMGEREILWGGLVKLSFKPFTNHKLSFNYMRNQSGTSRARFLQGAYPNADIDLVLQTRSISYLERGMNVFQLQGDHVFRQEEKLFGQLKMDWIGSLTYSGQEEPDLRYFSNEFRVNASSTQDTLYDIDQSGIYTAPARFYRSMTEENRDFKLNFDLPFNQWNELLAVVKFGGAYTYKQRDFDENRYIMSFGSKTKNYKGNPDNYFATNNLGIVDTFDAPAPFPDRLDMGLYYQDASEVRNDYTGEQIIFAFYFMTELPLSERLKLVTGVRYEDTDIRTVSMDETVDDGVIDLQDFLPAISFIYEMKKNNGLVKENMNLRFGYTRTLARPTFREFAPFASFDFDGDFLLVGNPGLQRTLIDNADLRWEWYPSFSELASVSVFYKNFQNPIERLLDPRAQNPQYEFRNVDNGVVYGVEFEIRKNFSFISGGLRKLELGANISLIQSRIDIDTLEYANIVAVDPTRPSRRPMFGQSPYAANAELAYVDSENAGVQASLSFNIFGPRIAIVGGSNPDVYEQPRGLLNFSLAKSLKWFSVRFRANNLLNPAYQLTQEYNPEGVTNDPFVFRSYKLGRSYSLGLSFSL